MNPNKDVNLPNSESRVQNTLTDCLDLLLKQGWKSVTISSGNVPVFEKGDKRFATPEFNEDIEEQDLTDYLEALGMVFLTYRKSLPYMYRSDSFSGSLFSLDYFPADRNNPESMVRFVWMGF